MVLADHQTAGRGQHGPPGPLPPGRFLFSVVLRPRLPVARWPEIPLAAGCAGGRRPGDRGFGLATKWRTRCSSPRGRRWPHPGRGVRHLPAGDPRHGVNVSQRDSDWPPDLVASAGSLASLGAASRARRSWRRPRPPSRLVWRAARRGLDPVRAAGAGEAPRPPHPLPDGEARPSISGRRELVSARRRRLARLISPRERPERAGADALMLLAVDVGNTTSAGRVHDRRLVASWRLTTRREQTAASTRVHPHMLRSHGSSLRTLTDVAISSTVPAVQRPWRRWRTLLRLSPFSWTRRQRGARHARRLPSRLGPAGSSGRGSRGSLRTAVSSSSISAPRRPSSACRPWGSSSRRHRPGDRTAAEALTAGRPGSRVDLVRRRAPSPQHGEPTSVGHRLWLTPAWSTPCHAVRAEWRARQGSGDGRLVGLMTASRARSTSSTRT